jgi:hypothetical protein
MRKEEIIKTLQASDSTLLSFKDRGPWGDNRYRGNCSGYIQAYLAWKYHVNYLSELFAGSGTGSDVCKDLGIKYFGMDLNPNPVRKDIVTFNALTDDVPDEVRMSDMCFMHPPYSELIKIPYAGSMYADPTGECSKSDLGQMPWDKFMNELNKVVMKFYSAMSKGSYMSILMGDVRRQGFHSMLTDIVKPGDMQQIIIKAQHNCVSNGRTYANSNFVPIVHEYIMVLKKASDLFIDFQLPKNYEMDVRDSKTATWADVVAGVLSSLGGRASLQQIYAKVDGHRKCETNNNWQAKIRQTLQMHSYFNRVSEGVWAIERNCSLAAA